MRSSLWGALLLLACASQPRVDRPTEPPGDTTRARRPAQQTASSAGSPVLCETGESEVCVCSDQTTGSRRCNEAGSAFGPCDACPDDLRCGGAHCQAIRVPLVALSLPACCPPGVPERCGVDVGWVARNWGYSAGCLELDAPGEADSSCPSAELPLPGGGSASLPGCRARSGACGYDVDVPDGVDLGCTEPPARSAEP